jgi:hypothetical protein
MKKSLVCRFPLSIALMFVFTASSALAANPVPIVTTSPAASKVKSAQKFQFTLQDLNRAKLTVKKPTLVLSWQTKVKLANDALTRDAAKVKTEVDGVLARSEQKSVECSTKNYTLQDLQALCKENEGVQACLDRLMSNCIMSQAGQQMQNSMADAMAAMNIKTYLERLRKDIDNLDQALYK